MKKVTSEDLLKGFYNKRSKRYRYFFPNTYVEEFEADILTINKNLYVDEFEIKVSKSDLLNDFNKGDKHLKLVEGLGLPNRFWFLIPQILLEEVEEHIPAYCGLLVMGKWRKFTIHKHPKRLHPNKVDEQTILQLTTKMMYRYNSLRFSNRK